MATRDVTLFENRCVLVVDNVTTSGATLEGAIRLLEQPRPLSGRGELMETAEG
jgi:hypoxanthine phosphoribosyltransferase